MDDEQIAYKLIVCAMIERAAMDLIEKPNKRGYFANNQSRKDLKSAKEFLFDKRLDSMIEILGIKIDIEVIREKVKKVCPNLLTDF